jgi:hypothetical protein
VLIICISTCWFICMIMIFDVFANLIKFYVSMMMWKLIIYIILCCLCCFEKELQFRKRKILHWNSMPIKVVWIKKVFYWFWMTVKYFIFISGCYLISVQLQFGLRKLYVKYWQSIIVKKMCRVSARRLSIYNSVWRLLKATKKGMVLKYLKNEKSKDTYGIYPTKFASSTQKHKSTNRNKKNLK